MPSGALADSSYTLTPEDMPLHKLVDETDRNSAIRTTTNDRISSQGAFGASFTSVKKKGEKCSKTEGDIFHAGNFAARQVEPRNTPTTINAAFFHRNFWDGRANNMFNGVGVFGMRDIQGDPNARLVVLEEAGQPQLDYLELENSSLASQAVAPPVSTLEMSCEGKTFADLGRKMLGMTPLGEQTVAPDDSVLGAYRAASGQGLGGYTYADLVKLAFDPKYWAADGRFAITDGSLKSSEAGYTQIEQNFSMFWGVAIMMYEQTLVSDQSELDSLVASGDLTTSGAGCTGTENVDPLLVRGCSLFFAGQNRTLPDGGKGAQCSACHSGPTFSENAFVNGQSFPIFLAVGDINGKTGLRDRGFANIGLRPWVSDPMSGGTDPYGNPLAFGRQYKHLLEGNPDAVVDAALADAIAAGNTALFGSSRARPWDKLEDDGSTKIPGLRNVALTPPYFSWGGYPSLRQMLKTYNRGLNRRDIPLDPAAAAGSQCVTGDDSGSGPDGDQPWPVQGPDCNTNATGLAVPLGLLDCDANGVPDPACAELGKDSTNDDLAALEHFLKALTDRRVQCDQAPFDHPSLVIHNGHTTSSQGHGRAKDISFTMPEVGASGFDPQSGFCIPNSGDLFAPGMQARSGGPRVPLSP